MTRLTRARVVQLALTYPYRQWMTFRSNTIAGWRRTTVQIWVYSACIHALILLTERMLLPMVEPIDRASSKQNKNTIWTLTCRSTAVRLIGAALFTGVSPVFSQVREKINPRRIAHELC